MTTPTRLTFALAAAALFLTLDGCYKGSWIKGNDEGDLSDASKAGIETFNPLVVEAMNKLLHNHAIEERAQGKRAVAFIGVENKSAEEMRDARDAIYEIIDTYLVNEQAYTPVNHRFVEAAMRSTGMRPDDLFLKNGRDTFMSAVSKEGITPEYLLFATLTSLTSQGVGQDQRNYLLTLELVDANSGETSAKETAQIRKGYNH